MRPASSRVVTPWISVLCLLATLLTLDGPALAQAATGSKRKLSPQSLSQTPVATPEIPPPVTTDTWKGGASGDWSVAGNWNNGAITSGEDILINTTTAATSDDSNFNIGTLTLSNAGDSVTILNNVILSVAGNITNNGTIAIDSGGNNTFLTLPGSITLSGTGTLVLGQSGPNYIDGNGGVTLTNASTITGGNNANSDFIGNGHVLIANTGTINANVSGDGMQINPGGASTNTGTLEATNGGTLYLSGATWTQSGAGTVLAQTGSTVFLYNGVTITGGTLNTSGTGVVADLASNTVTLSNLTNSGTFNIQNNAITDIAGTITNNGTINLQSGGNNTYLSMPANSTLAGTGTLNLGQNGANYIDGAQNVVFTNDSTITGGNNANSDLIGNGHLAVVNHGTINANVSGDGMQINPGAASTNTKLLEATNGGTLYLDGGSWTNTGGTITAATGSTVGLYNGVSITGGTLSTSGTGVVESLTSAGVSLSNLTNAGTFNLLNNSITTISGTITNNGTINMQSTGNNTFLSVTSSGSESATLTGTGTLILGTSGPNYIDGGGSSSLTIDQLIQGVGNIGNGHLTLVNNSTIDANISPTVSASALVLDAGAGGLTNTSILEATNGGTLVLYGGGVTNTGGIIQAVGSDSSSNPSIVALENGVSVTNGTLTTSGAGVVEDVASNTVFLKNVTNKGTYDIQNNAITQISGTITNNGTINLQSGGNNTFLSMAANSTLTGTGTLILGQGGANYIDGAQNVIFTNDSTITGGNNGNSDFIGNGHLAVVNNGTIDANVSGDGMQINPGAASTNTKLLEATNGGVLYLDNGSWTNTGGTITAATGSTVVLYNGVSITGGTLSATGTGVVEEGQSTTVTLSNLTISGTYDIQNNAITQISGTITNNGTMNLQSGGSNTFLSMAANSTLAGTGTLNLGQNGANYIDGAQNVVFTNDSTITGGNNANSDFIGNGHLAVVNNGTIDANVNGDGMQINPGAPSTNTKLLEATNGGALYLDGGVWTNTGGTITAATGSTVGLYNGVTVTGGTLSTSGTGVLETLASQAVNLNGVTIAGTYDILNNSNTTLSGTITNNGTINMESGGNNTFLIINGAVTLKGTGALVLGDGGPNYIGGTGTTPVLNNQSTIEGTGNIGNGSMGLTNTGTLDSNVTGGTLAINVNGSGFTNYNGTTDTLTGGSYIANGGNITFAAGNTMGITTLSASVTEEAGGQLINTTNGSNALAGLTSITSTGSLTTDVNLTDAGAFSNAGSLTILKGTTFDVKSLTQIAGGSLTAGTYVLDANLNITGATQSFTTNAANVTLAGGIFHNANGTNAMSALAANTGKLTLAGNATFTTTAASFSNTGTLTINAGSSFSTKALAQITGTGSQTLSGGTFVLDGNLDVSTGTANITTNSATLTLEGTGTIENTSNSSNALLNLASNTKSLTLASAANFATTGNFSNSGTLTVNSGSTFTVLSGKSLTNYTAASNTLTGGTYVIGGTLAFNAGTTGAIKTDAANLTLDGTGELKNTTSGAASTNALVNLATISSAGSFTLASNANFTAAGGFTNSGKLTINSGSAFTLTGTHTLTNLASGTLTGGTYTVGGTLQLTATNGGITTNAANLTVTGTTAKILDGTTNALAGFDNNTSTGTFTLAGNAVLTTAAANFTDAGTLDVAKGSTLTVGGTGHNYNQTAGKTTIDGTLAGITAATVTGGELLGAGTMKGNLSVGNASGTAATINVGDSGVAGLLSITGKYTQLATGTMTGTINGTAAGTGFSQLKVTGAAALAGTINFTVATAFQASLTLGEKFTVLSASSVTGTFSNTTIAINSTFEFTVSYTSTGVVLTVASTPSQHGTTQTATASAKSAVAAVVKNPVKSKSPVVVSGLRRASATEKPAAGKLLRPIVVAEWEHSSARLASESALNGLRSWERSPAVHAWPVATTPTPRAANENLVRSQPEPGLWRTQVNRPIETPLAGRTGFGNRQSPVRILSPMLPRTGR